MYMKDKTVQVQHNTYTLYFIILKLIPMYALVSEVHVHKYMSKGHY